MRNFFICLIGAVFLAGCGFGGRAYKTDGYEAGGMAAKSSSKEGAAVKSEKSERLFMQSTSLKLDVEDSEKASRKIAKRAREIGGHVAEESDKFIVVLVPTNKLDDFIEYLEDTVGKIMEKERRGRDITDSHNETAAELEALRASRDTYKSMLKKADKVDDMLEIEKELERLNVKILQLEARQKQASKDVAFSRVAIRLDDSTVIGTLLPLFVPIAGLALLLLLL